MKFVILEAAFSEGLAWTAVDLNIKLLNSCEVRDNRYREGRAFVVTVNESALTGILPSSMT
jgi:hypothetical protein